MENKNIIDNELENVAGGANVGGGALHTHDFLYNETDERLFSSLSFAEKCEVLAQPDTASRRAKMFEIYRRNGSR